MNSNSNILVKLNNVGFRENNKWLVEDVSLQVEKGKIVTLIGPNGSGKSTTAKIALGIYKNIEGNVEKYTDKVGYVPQKISIDWTLPLRVNDFMVLTENIKHDQIDEALSLTGVIHLKNKNLGNLSGGEFQRVLLARAISKKPELLVLDEPTVAVDVEARMDLWHLIEGLRDSGTTILLTSHHLAEAQRLCNRVALMRYGKVVAEGSVPELISRVPGQAVVKVQSEDNQAVIKRAFELGWSVRQHAGKISLLLPNNLNLREVVDALDGSKVNAISIDPVTLEDAYLELVGDSSSISLNL